MNQRGLEIKVRRRLERQPAFADIAFVLDAIEGDAHEAYCTYKEDQGNTAVTPGLCRSLTMAGRLPAAPLLVLGPRGW
jgi:hypothetical protein